MHFRKYFLKNILGKFRKTFHDSVKMFYDFLNKVVFSNPGPDLGKLSFAAAKNACVEVGTEKGSKFLNFFIEKNRKKSKICA